MRPGFAVRVLRQRRLNLLMQPQPARGESSSGSLAARIGPSLKRSASQAAAAAAAVASLKTDDFRSAKHSRLSTSDLASHHMPGPSSRQPGGPNASQGTRKGRSGATQQARRGRPSQSTRNIGASSGAGLADRDTLSEPLADEAYIKKKYDQVDTGISLKGSGLGSTWQTNPKSALTNFMTGKLKKPVKFEVESGALHRRKVTRVKINVIDDVVVVGDAGNRKEAEKLACLAACYEIIARGLYKTDTAPSNPTTEVILSDGSRTDYDKARQFMDYYCRKYRFRQPLIDYQELKGRGRQGWEAVMTVDGRRIGIGSAKSKQDANKSCYLDAVGYLEKCDPALWQEFIKLSKTGKDLGLASKVLLEMSNRLEDDVENVNWQMKKSQLFSNMPEAPTATRAVQSEDASSSRGPYRYRREELETKSAELLKRRKAYLSDPTQEVMRRTRQNLPVYSRAEDALKHIEENEVTILMAATGSGKTTQIPQLILDSYTDKGIGAKCNIFCTQPRRLAAISVAQRVAKERGERVGSRGSIGYQVRFESALPEENGSVTFCTIGTFLKRMQTALQRGHDRILDNVTHVVVDEVHERDIDTDLLLVVLKRLLEDRRAKGNSLKVILMSATVDATLFQKYFTDTIGKPASLIEIPGRSFPVKKHFLDDFLPSMIQQHRDSRWVFGDEKVVKYIYQELPNTASILPSSPALRRASDRDRDEDLEIPYPLVCLTISHVLQHSDSGHVLVFLPGWDEIQNVQKLLTSWSQTQSFGLNFNDRSKFAIHILHSSIPLAEQQVIFDPPPDGVRRIILSTNIAETSVTIPDVVYVVDTAKIKENRYDPERHISSLVSAWVGTSNLNQRAGRAGRHRPGEYYGIIGQRRANTLHSHQMVEMKRMDLSNVVMHVKALDFPGMEVEDVLARTIEPPSEDRVIAAMENLRVVGALDEGKNLTSLGRILLQLPVDAQIGRLVLYGCFFKCLDQALTLAALFSSRDPFLCPPTARKEAQAKKDSWCPEEFRSDALAGLKAFNAWHEYERQGNTSRSIRFCSENFLSRPTLMMAAKVKQHILESLAQTGILDVCTGGNRSTTFGRTTILPSELNANGDSAALLAALIAIASQPKFAIRAGAMTYRTALEKVTVMHPSSVNHRKRTMDEGSNNVRERQLYAFWEKRQNLSIAGQGPSQMSLIGTTRLDPMTYVLFGAYNLEATEGGLECDGWLPIIGNLNALDDVRRLKLLMEGCMLRVFEGINNSNFRGARQRSKPSETPNRYIPPALRQNRDNDEDESGDEEENTIAMSHGPLSDAEMRELGLFTQSIADILDRYADERRQIQSLRSSRAATPTLTPLIAASRALSGSGSWRSGASTPSRYESRPPSRLSAIIGR